MLDPDEIAAYEELRGIVARLRAPDGCPWDRDQTHESLKPYLIQEAYEVLAVLDQGETMSLPEEMGDLLFQLLIHTQLAEESGEFRMVDILRGLATKLVRRHPHVFGERKLDTADQVVAQWEELKREERSGRASAVEGVPKALPALAYAQELLRRAAGQGFEWPDRRDVLHKIEEELEELATASGQRQRTEEFGDILINLVNYARYSGIDAEEALRLSAAKFRLRFERVEKMAGGRALSEMDVAQLLELWARAKAMDQA